MAPTNDVVLIGTTNAVRTVTFNRPDKLNAFDTGLYRAVSAALHAASIDDEVSAVVLTGAGRAFSAGQDLDEMALLATGATSDSGFPDFLDSLQSFDKPLLCAVNGLGIGIGFTLLAHCDLVVVSTDARFRVPFAPLGVPPEAASSYLFPLRMGWQRAAHVLFTGDWVSAAEAVEWGLALETAAPGQVLARAQELAERIATSPLDALRAIKTAMLAGQRDAISAARSHEDAAFAELLGSAATLDALDRFGEAGKV